MTFGLIVAALYVEKRPLQAWLGARDEDLGGLFRFADVAGSGWAMLAVGLALAVSRHTARAAITFGVAGLWAFLLTQLGAFVLAEARPRDGGAMHFFALHGHGVSGHACAAALLFFPLRDLLGAHRRALLGPLLLAWAVFIAWSRVRMNMHYAWNVLLGAGIGFYVSAVTVKVARGLRA